MNYLIVIPCMTRGGAERTASYLANYIVDRDGNSVSIAVFDNNESTYQLDARIEYIKLGLSSTDLKYRLPAAKKIRKLICNNQVDVVLGFSSGASILVSLAAKGLKCKAYGSERSNPYIKNYSSIYRALQNILLSKLDGMIFTTRGCRDFYSDSVRNKSVVIPNGLFANTQRSKIGDDFKHNICAVGNLRPEKDYPTMLKAFATFLKKCPNNALFILGEGTEREKIEKYIDELGLSNSVTLCGLVDNPNEYYGQSDILIHTSISESWCNVILEALGTGLPCVVTDCDFGPREMIKDGVNGFLVKVGDSDALAERMVKLYMDFSLYKEMAKNAFQSIEQFNPENVAKQYYDFLQR